MTSKELSELKNIIEDLRFSISLLDNTTCNFGRLARKRLAQTNQYLTSLYIKTSLEKDENGGYIYEGKASAHNQT